ncbi:MAG TPA: hypothetical protein VMT34_03300 [Aggregatilineales bacterium]|nr:hypothetical protein [Aggregatilineales bacterium]
MPVQNIFYDDWRACLQAHYAHVVKEGDAVHEQSLTAVLGQTGFSPQDLEQLRSASQGSHRDVPHEEIDPELAFEVLVSYPEPDPAEDLADESSLDVLPNNADLEPLPTLETILDPVVAPIDPVLAEAQATPIDAPALGPEVLGDTMLPLFSDDFSAPSAPEEVPPSGKPSTRKKPKKSDKGSQIALF